MYIQHGGKFYLVDGSNHYVMVPRFDFRTDKFSYQDIEDEVGKLGYVSWKSIYKVPNSFDYKVIKNNGDTREMLSHISDRCGVLHLFVDDGKLGESDEVEELPTEVQCNWDEDELGGDNPHVHIEVDNVSDGGQGRDDTARHTEDKSSRRETERDSKEADNDYILEEIDESTDHYTDDEMSDDGLCSDEEYIEARRVLRDRSERGLCDEVFNKIGHECGNFDYEHSDGDVNSEETDEDGDKGRPRKRRVVYDPLADHRTLKLEMHMKFADRLEARDAIRRQAIEDDREIHFKRVSQTQTEARCKPPCKWGFYDSLVKANGSFEIKRIDQPHTCTSVIRKKIITSCWIAKEYLNVFRYMLDLTVRELMQDIMRRYNCRPSGNCTRKKIRPLGS